MKTIISSISIMVVLSVLIIFGPSSAQAIDLGAGNGKIIVSLVSNLKCGTTGWGITYDKGHYSIGESGSINCKGGRATATGVPTGIPLNVYISGKKNKTITLKPNETRHLRF